MNRIDKNITLFPGARVLFEGEIYNIIEEEIIEGIDPIMGNPFAVQTFWLNKTEAGKAADIHKLIQVLPTEIIPLAGNDYYETSAFNLGIQEFLGNFGL